MSQKLNRNRKRAPYPHIAIGLSLFLVCIGVFGAINKQLITFSTGTKNNCKFTSGQVQFLHHICAKKFQQLVEKHVREHLRSQFTARKKNSFNDYFGTKKIFIKNPLKDYVQKKVRGHNDRNAYKTTFNLHYRVKIHKNNLQHRKRSKLRSARELTVRASSLWNLWQTPINGSEAKKRFAVCDVSKS